MPGTLLVLMKSNLSVFAYVLGFISKIVTQHKVMKIGTSVCFMCVFILTLGGGWPLPSFLSLQWGFVWSVCSAPAVMLAVLVCVGPSPVLVALSLALPCL